MSTLEHLSRKLGSSDAEERREAVIDLGRAGTRGGPPSAPRLGRHGLEGAEDGCGGAWFPLGAMKLPTAWCNV